MSKKVYNLIVGLVGAIGAAGVVLVTFFDPPYAAAINGSIEIATVAVAEICSQFLDPNKLGKN